MAVKQASFFAPDLNVIGTIHSPGSLEIEGVVKGDVAVGDLVVGSTGRLNARIGAGRVTSAGTVAGTIKARAVNFLRGGAFRGEVEYEALTIDPESDVEARMHPVEQGSPRMAVLPAVPEAMFEVGGGRARAEAVAQKGAAQSASRMVPVPPPTIAPPPRAKGGTSAPPPLTVAKRPPPRHGVLWIGALAVAVLTGTSAAALLSDPVGREWVEETSANARAWLATLMAPSKTVDAENTAGGGVLPDVAQPADREPTPLTPQASVVAAPELAPPVDASSNDAGRVLSEQVDEAVPAATDPVSASEAGMAAKSAVPLPERPPEMSREPLDRGDGTTGSAPDHTAAPTDAAPSTMDSSSDAEAAPTSSAPPASVDEAAPEPTGHVTEPAPEPEAAPTPQTAAPIMDAQAPVVPVPPALEEGGAVPSAPETPPSNEPAMTGQAGSVIEEQPPVAPPAAEQHPVAEVDAPAPETDDTVAGAAASPVTSAPVGATHTPIDGPIDATPMAEASGLPRPATKPAPPQPEPSAAPSAPPVSAPEPSPQTPAPATSAPAATAADSNGCVWVVQCTEDGPDGGKCVSVRECRP